MSPLTIFIGLIVGHFVMGCCYLLQYLRIRKLLQNNANLIQQVVVLEHTIRAMQKSYDEEAKEKWNVYARQTQKWTSEISSYVLEIEKLRRELREEREKHGM